MQTPNFFAVYAALWPPQLDGRSFFWHPSADSYWNAQLSANKEQLFVTVFALGSQRWALIETKIPSPSFRDMRHQILFTTDLKSRSDVFSLSPPTCTKYSALERHRLFLRMQLSKPLLQPAMNVWRFVPTFYKTKTQILHRVYLLYHTFPHMQTAMKVACICETQRPQKSVSQLTVPLILNLHKHFSSLWFSQNSSSYFIFFRTKIWKKSDTQFQLLKYIYVGSPASEAELGWEIICLLKTEISP